MKKVDYQLLLLKNLSSSKNDKELCEKLDINYSTLDTWKNKNQIPQKKLAGFAMKLNIDIVELENINNETTLDGKTESVTSVTDKENEKEFTFYFDRVLSNYRVPTLKDLSEVTNIPISTLSSIKQRNSITGLKKKCRELNIFDEIFGDIDLSEVSKLGNIVINHVLLEKASEEAKKFGLDVNAYLEHLIIQDLKK